MNRPFMFPLVAGTIDWVNAPRPIPPRIVAAFNVAGDFLSKSLEGKHGTAVGPEDDPNVYYAAALVHALNAFVLSWHWGTLPQLEAVAMVAWSKLFGPKWGDESNNYAIKDLVDADSWGGTRAWVSMSNVVSEVYRSTGDDDKNRSPQLRRLAFLVVSTIVFRNAMATGTSDVFGEFIMLLVEHERLALQEITIRYAQMTN